MLDLLRRSDRSSDTVIGTVDGTPLAVIPAEVQREAQNLVTRLLVHRRDVPRSIALTSHLAGEGVSFMSRAVATAVSRTRHTCLLEANWWGKGVPLPTPNPGLAGVLLGTASIDDVVVATNHPGLSIIPAGELEVTDREALVSAESVRSLLLEMQQRYDHVLLDLPALSTAPTALRFAQAADGSLLVVRQRLARIDNIEQSLTDLRPTNFLGVVLNSNKLSMPKLVQRRLLQV